ncbi:unnamed protein product [Menidia menidia]|uniref:(Atlantic silverside) hypothetical protein n=1 Tax=Menidia menidia TaxID=238744 RepID=A0A8S4ART9_9TELE|nr:unnamed protein product [Menidia menidia]
MAVNTPFFRKPLMAVPFVPVPLPVDWCRESCSKGGIPVHSELLFTNQEPFYPKRNHLGRRQEPCGWTVKVKTGKRPIADMLNEASNPLEDEEKDREIWEESSIATTLLGYEILKQRSKFTIYKVLVRGCHGNSWMIFRRYSDFCRLNDKLKELFPSFDSTLPPKRCFKGKYKEDFLRERQLGLQTFLHDLMLHKHIFTSESVRSFLSFADFHSPFDSLEESRAICETLEETNHRLQRELLEKKEEIGMLRKTLEERENHINLLMKKLRWI